MLAHSESSNCLRHERPLLNPIDTAERSSQAFEDLPSMLPTNIHRYRFFTGMTTGNLLMKSRRFMFSFLKFSGKVSKLDDSILIQLLKQNKNTSKKYIEVHYEKCNEALMTLTTSNNKHNLWVLSTLWNCKQWQASTDQFYTSHTLNIKYILEFVNIMDKKKKKWRWEDSVS